MNIGKINKLRGIFPVIPSLFHDDNTLDLESQRKVVQFALNAGSHGVVFPGDCYLYILYIKHLLYIENI